MPRTNFRLGSTFAHPDWPTRNVAVADLNGGGSVDPAVPNPDGGQSYVYLND